MRDYPITLSAGVERSLNVAGSFWHLIKASGEVKLGFDEGAKITRSQGMAGTAKYTRITVLSPINQTVTVSLGFGQSFDARAAVEAVVNAAVEPSNSNSALPQVTIAAGQTVEIAPANAARKELRIQVKSDQVGGVNIGDANVNATKGGFVEVGMVDYVASEAAMYAHNPNAASVTVNVLDLSRV